VHNGRDVWTYTSSSNQVSHTVLPAGSGTRTHHDANVDANTPTGVADTILKAIDPSTAVSVDSTQRVAGRDAYTLVLSPRDHRSTVRKVTIAVDSKKFVPLQVQIFGSGSTPAIQIGFRDVSFTTPKAAEFDFHMPAGANVVTNPLQERRHHHVAAPRPNTGGKPAATGAKAAPKVIGSGWTSVVEFPNGLPLGATGGLLDRLTAPGSNGERVLTTALINGVLLKDGRVFIGAVTPSMLEHVAATTPR
jgi:hypothetical protein